jgi:two-component system sensor histidine kinase TctE
VWRLGILVSLVVLLGAAVTLALARYFASHVLDQWLFDSASTLATQIKSSTGRAQLDLPRSAVEMFEFDAVDRVFYDVTTAEGLRIFGNAPLAIPDNLSVGGAPTFYDAWIIGRPVRVAAIKVPGPEGLLQPVIVQVAETTNKRDALFAQMLTAILVPQVALLLLAALAIWYGVSSGMRSLEDIARRLAGYRPDRPVTLPTTQDAPIEVRPLLAALHEVVNKLDEAQATQKRFIANASHQLRTPLAALQVQAERALREPDPVKHSEALESVLKTLRRLRHLSHQLLMLARAEPVGTPSIALQPIDLATLAREELQNWTDAAIESGADLGYDGPTSGVRVMGERQLLHELVGNLVDNAIRYGGRGVNITVGLEGGARPKLVVEDDGPGIPASERELVLERFYRRAQSRGEGTGLGLSIAREIAGRHGADLSIEEGPGGKGTRVIVEFGRAG